MRDGWEPRQLSSGAEDGLWRRLRLISRVGYRSSPVGVVLQREDEASMTAKRGAHRVTLVGAPGAPGAPGELVLHAFGRDAVRLQPTGAPADVEAVLSLDRSF